MNHELYHASNRDYAPGDIISTSGETNRYWRRLFLEGAIEPRDWFNVSNHVNAQNQQFLRQKYHFRSQAFKEMVFEIHRLQEVSERPSRRTCRFLMDNPAAWREELREEGEERSLFTAEVVDERRRFRADAGWLGNNGGQYREFQDWAHSYWSGEEHEKALWEILFEAEARIVEKVSWDNL